MALQLTVHAEDLVAEGASAQVFRARRGGRDVAIKVALSRDADAFLIREARALALQLDPSLPRLREVERVAGAVLPGRVALVLDWIDGISLDARPSVDPRTLAVSLATALACLEAAGVAHGDVKPSNVVVGATGASLVDLGMVTPAASRALVAATPRYLSSAPEVEEACQRDRFALGLVLAETLSIDVARAPNPIGAARSLSSDSLLGSLVAALLSDDPRARPSPRAIARWLHRESERSATEVEGRYLLARQAELEHVAVGAVDVAETLPSSVARAVALLSSCFDADGAARSDEGIVVGPLDLAGRNRWLGSLVGPAVADWPIATLPDVDDRVLVERLTKLASALAPEAWTFEALLSAAQGDGPVASTPREIDDPVELALLLSKPRPAAEGMHAAVARFRGLPASLKVATIDALRRGGRPEVGLALVADDDPPSVIGAASEAARRAGALAVAERLSARAPGDPRARATALRIRADRGDALDDDGPMTPATAEAHALLLLRLGRRHEARGIAERGLAAATGDEERARLQGLLAYVDHADGRPDDAWARFVEASRSAARAGAIVEEATYLTGVAAAAVDAGSLSDGGAAARRAAALFSAVDRPSDAARAMLSEASMLAIVDAAAEARSLAREAISLAGRGGDVRAAVLARLTLADAGDPSGLAEAARFATGEDVVRVAARQLTFGATVDVDAVSARLADGAVSPVAALEWWAATLRAGSPVDLFEVERWLGRGPVPARFAAATALFSAATRDGRHDIARRSALVARDLGARLVEGAATEHKSVFLARLEIAALPALPSEDPRRSQAKLSEALALVRALSSRERLGPLFSQILDALLLWTGAERGVFLAPAPDGRLVPRVARNLPLDELRRGEQSVSRSAVQRAIDERRPIAMVDTGHTADVTASVHALKLLRVLAVPLLARGRVLGVVYLDDRVRPQAFAPEDLAWVELLAGIAAAAVGDAFDQVLLRRSSRKAERANARLSGLLAERDATLAAIETALPPSRKPRRHHAIVGACDALTRALELCDRVASRDLPVLITGESGSGKELFARALHDASRRRGGRFVSENCAAIPEGLLESTLFGHVRGAFTGAVTPQPGLFVIADNGTLLLDEVGEMSLAMQAKLLRVLADGEVRAVGGASSRKVDVRLIAATHRDLAALVRDGKFREDLFYRLRVVELRVPPLRERVSDVPLLVAHFLKKHDMAGYSLTKGAMDRLMACPWPGNVRQLENEIRRASVLSDGLIDVSHLSPELLDLKNEPATGSLRDRIDALSRRMVVDALSRHPSKTAVAEELGLSRFGLLKMMKRLEIDG